MIKTMFTLVAFLLLCSISFGQTKKDMNVNFMLRGHIYAESSIHDSTAAGGFGGSDNLPKIIEDSLNFDKNGLFLKIDTTQLVIISDKYNGYKLFIVNQSDTIVKLAASDSRLYAIAEVYYKDKWQPIEYLPSSWCGNSYHNVYLKPNEYWTFEIPKFTGKTQVKLRYRLKVGTNKYIYSNEISASINKKQVTEKKGHKPNGLMDPYND